jgi:hypothetical protein
VPFKCKFHNNPEYKTSYGEQSKSFASLQQLSDHLAQLNETNLDEVSIELPKSQCQTTGLDLESIEFIDCIGQPDSTYPNAKTLIQKSVGKGVDAVIFYTRSLFQEEELICAYECGLFSFDDSQPPPVIIQAYLADEDDFKQKDFDVDFRNGRVRQEMQTSLSSGFEKIEYLKKDKILPVLKENCDAICLKRNQSKLEQISLLSFQNTIERIKNYKFKYVSDRALDKMFDICDEMTIRISCQIRVRNRATSTIYNDIFNYLYMQSAYKKMIKKKKELIDAILNEYLQSVVHIFENEDLFSLDIAVSNENNHKLNLSAIKNYIEINHNDLILRIAKQIQKILTEIKNKIEQLRQNEKYKLSEDTKKDLKNVLDSLEKSYERYIKRLNVLSDTFCIKNDIQAYFEETLNATAENKDGKLSGLLNDLIIKFKKWLECIFGLIETIKYTVIAENCIDGNLDQLNKKISDICNIKMRGELRYRIINSIEDKRITLSSCIKPGLYSNTHHSNFLPRNDQVFDFERLKPVEISVDVCKKQKWIHSSQPDWIKKNQIDCLNLEKSKIRILHTKPNELSSQDAELYGPSIQLVEVIEKEPINVKFMYDKKLILGLVDSLNDKISSYQKEISETKQFEHMALHPIFIYSKSKKFTEASANKEIPKNSYKPNLLVNQLAESLEPSNFLVFLFIEAGMPTDRLSKTKNSFKAEVDFYENIKVQECKSNAALKKRVINVYLPKKNMDTGSIYKIMMLLAEGLCLARYYIIKDDLYQFYEFCKFEGGIRKYFKEPQVQVAARSLAFMSIVLESGIAGNQENQKEIDGTSLRKFSKVIDKFKDAKVENDFDKLMDTLYELNSNKNKKLLFFNLMDQLKVKRKVDSDASNEICSFDEKKDFHKVENLIKGPYSKTLGQVSLFNRRNVKLEHLDRINPTTHYVAKQENIEIVLYNQDAIKGNLEKFNI